MIDGPACCIGCRQLVDRFEDERHLKCYMERLQELADGVKYVTINGWAGGGAPPIIPELAGQPGSKERRMAMAEGRSQQTLIKGSKDRWGHEGLDAMREAMAFGRTSAKYPPNPKS